MAYRQSNVPSYQELGIEQFSRKRRVKMALFVHKGGASWKSGKYTVAVYRVLNLSSLLYKDNPSNFGMSVSGRGWVEYHDMALLDNKRQVPRLSMILRKMWGIQLYCTIVSVVSGRIESGVEKTKIWRENRKQFYACIQGNNVINNVCCHHD